MDFGYIGSGVRHGLHQCSHGSDIARYYFAYKKELAKEASKRSGYERWAKAAGTLGQHGSGDEKTNVLTQNLASSRVFRNRRWRYDHDVAISSGHIFRAKPASSKLHIYIAGSWHGYAESDCSRGYILLLIRRLSCIPKRLSALRSKGPDKHCSF